MKLTENKLKKLINEVLSEGIGDNFYGMFGNKTQDSKPIKPSKPADTGPAMPKIPEEIKPDQAEKIMKMLQSDDESMVNQALMFVDALAPDSSFAEDYLKYLGPSPNVAISALNQSQDPDERIDLRKKVYDQINQRAARLYPDDKDAANNWAMDKIEKAGLLEGNAPDVFLEESLLYEGDDSILSLFENATLEEGGNACGACLFEQLQEASCGCPNLVYEAEYRGRKVTLNKPMRGDVKKFKVYVKDPKTGNIKKVNFGDPNMKIKKSNPKRRKSFRARHNCDNPGPKTKARYWSCKKW